MRWSCGTRVSFLNGSSWIWIAFYRDDGQVESDGCHLSCLKQVDGEVDWKLPKQLDPEPRAAGDQSLVNTGPSTV